MMEKTVHEYIDHQPFHTYYLTVSGHQFYTFMDNMMDYKNRNLVRHLPFSHQGRAYLATRIELDKALEYLLYQLEEADIADKTLIALCTDYYPYGLDDSTIEELAGHEVEQNLEYDSRLLMGRDIFSDAEPLVIFRNRSFITDKGRYNAVTREFIPNHGEYVSQDYIDTISAKINNKFYYSARILDTNYYDKI